MATRLAHDSFQTGVDGRDGGDTNGDRFVVWTVPFSSSDGSCVSHFADSYYGQLIR